jgi:predicted RNA-binding protein with PIN domain
MAAHLVIDGYNLMAAVGGLSDIEAGREALLKALAAYKRRRKVRVTVVFDGRGLARDSERRFGVEVIFSRGGEEADHIIKDLAASYGHGAVVVSSDSVVSAHARSRGAVVMGSDEFAGLMDRAVYEELKGVGPGDEVEADPSSRPKKGPSRRPNRGERLRLKRLKKL